MASVLVPVAYVIIVFGGLILFSHIYRKRSASTFSSLQTSNSNSYG